MHSNEDSNNLTFIESCTVILYLQENQPDTPVYQIYLF